MKEFLQAYLLHKVEEKEDSKYVECDPATKCSEWKNEANRRVYFVAR